MHSQQQQQHQPPQQQQQQPSQQQQQQQQPPSQLQSHNPQQSQPQQHQAPQQQSQPQSQQQQHPQQPLPQPPVSQHQQQQHPSHPHHHPQQQQQHYHAQAHHGGPHHMNHHHGGHPNQQMMHQQQQQQAHTHPQHRPQQSQHTQQPPHQQQHQQHHNSHHQPQHQPHHHHHHPQQHQHQPPQQHQHHHPQQQQQQQQQHPQHQQQLHHPQAGQPHQIPPTQHMVPHGPPQMIQYPQSMMYPHHPMSGHPHLYPAGSHVPPQFNHNPSVPPPPPQGHRPDQINVSSQQTQQPHQPQQAPPQPGSINPNNIPPLPPAQHMGPMHPTVINTSTTGTTGVHQLNNGPIMDSQMQNRIPLSQPYMMPHYNMNPYSIAPHMMPFPMPPQNYPGPPIPGPNTAMLAPRLPTDIAGIRPYEPHNHAASVVAKVPISQPAPILGTKPPGPVPLVSAAVVPQPPTITKPLPKREKIKLAIVDPKTKHVFTDDELKGLPPKSTTASATASTTTTSTTTTAATTTAAAATTITSTITSTTATTTSATTTKANLVTSPTVPTAEVEKSITITTTSEKQAAPAPQNQSTNASQPNSSVPSSVSTGASSPTVVSPQHSDRNASSTTPSTVSPKSPIAHAPAAPATAATTTATGSTTITPTTIASEQSTTNNAISKSQPNIVEGLQNLSISNSKTSTLTNTSQTSPTITNNGDSQAGKDAVDHAIVEHDSDVTKGEVKETKDQDTEEQDSQDETPKITLNPKFPYEPGQYSPLNRSGHRKYTIKFLKAVGESMKLTEPVQNQHNQDFMPNFLRGPNHANRGYDNYAMPRRSSQQALNNRQPPRKIIATQSLQPEVELKTAEKPWKPELDSEKSKAVEAGEIDTQRLLKLFRGHLNKITPQKYDSIMAKVNELDLSSDEKLKSVIDLVFDKAVDEPGFCEIYARMSKVIAIKNSRFNYHLVKKCQDEFETSDLYDGLNVESRELDIERETDPDKKKRLSEELYEDMRLRRKKYLGTVKLIGEMYKLGLLIPKIIGMCMRRLIEEASNENIECLCSLIATVGAKMANEQEEQIKSSFKHTLSVLHDIAHHKKTDKLFTLESRVKFKILDTIDLSKKNWKPRMVENNPMKLEEIRDEAKRESAIKQHNHTKSHPKGDDRNRGRATFAPPPFNRRNY